MLYIVNFCIVFWICYSILKNSKKDKANTGITIAIRFCQIEYAQKNTDASVCVFYFNRNKYAAVISTLIPLELPKTSPRLAEKTFPIP